MVSGEKVRNKIREIKKAVDKLQKYREMPDDRFLQNFESTDAARYNLQVAVESMLDIATHIIARKNLELPKSNAEAFAILCRHGILSREKEKVYMAMARFRNRIVHLYDQVDDSEVHRIIRENLPDYSVFIGEITLFMEREADS
jgi:uncharacterized protein YutE (UPF0331/DUF86 family)